MGVTFKKKPKLREVEMRLLDHVTGTSKNFVFMSLCDINGEFHNVRINVDTGEFIWLPGPKEGE